MTGTLRDKMVALKKRFNGNAPTIDRCIALLDEHCAGQRERFEEWYKHYPYCQLQDAWQAAIATIRGDV